jgi:hypothetical protein
LADEPARSRRLTVLAEAAAVLALVVAIVGVFVFWEGLVSDLAAIIVMVAIAGAHAFVLSLTGLTLIWAAAEVVGFHRVPAVGRPQGCDHAHTQEEKRRFRALG